MQGPDVRNSIRDEEYKTTYHIMAYRKLSYEEMVTTIRAYYAGRRKKKRETGKEITIITVIGCDQ